MRQRILLGKLADSTWERYQQTLRAFKSFLDECRVSELPEMSRPFIEKFKVWRLAKIREKNFSRGGRGLALDVAILHRVFGVGVECEMIAQWTCWRAGRILMTWQSCSEKLWQRLKSTTRHW